LSGVEQGFQHLDSNISFLCGLQNVSSLGRGIPSRDVLFAAVKIERIRTKIYIPLFKHCEHATFAKAFREELEELLLSE